MRELAVKLLLKSLKYLGVKTAIRLGWKYFFYPKLMVKAKSTDPKWDEKLVQTIDDNLESILKLF